MRRQRQVRTRRVAAGRRPPRTAKESSVDVLGVRIRSLMRSADSQLTSIHLDRPGSLNERYAGDNAARDRQGWRIRRLALTGSTRTVASGPRERAV